MSQIKQLATLMGGFDVRIERGTASVKANGLSTIVLTFLITTARPILILAFQ